MTSRRALVTGSTGFLGKAVCSELEGRGFEVIRTTRRAVHGHVLVDIGNAASVRTLFMTYQPAAVFHLAGSADSAAFSELLEVNCGFAANLLDAAQGYETSLVFTGTAAEYGPQLAEAGPVTEDRPAQPGSPYGVTKLAQTGLALAAFRRGQRVVVARPSNIIGPGVPRHLAFGSFIAQLSAIRQGRSEPVLRVGGLDAVRDLVDVRDVARALVDLSSVTQAAGKIFNVSAGQGISMASALEQLIAAFGVKVRVETSEHLGRSSSVSWFVASNQRLSATVDYHPRSLQESLAHIAAEPFAET